MELPHFLTVVFTTTNAFSRRPIAQLFQYAHVTDQGAEKCARASIRQTEFSSGFFHKACNFSVVNMADIREQMVLNLEIESPDVPGKPAAVISKIWSG